MPRGLATALAVSVLVTAPLLLGASDPRGDARPCTEGSDPGDPPDLIAARAVTEEEGTGLRVTLRFARPLPVPDTKGKPFRVDVLLRDPSVPTVSFEYYHGLNRILRYDATPNAPVEIYLLPEHGQNVFYGATVSGDTLTMRIPGRIITLDEDLNGGPHLVALRWGAIVRDGGRCDLLGAGRPTYRVVEGPSGTVETVSLAPAAAADASHRGPGWPWWVIALIVVAVVAALLAGTAVYRRRVGDG